MSKKIGFWSVFGIVTGSQIGTTIFMSPASLAPYGFFSLLGWLISGVGAMSSCMVFSSLCARFPETGGPHAYVKHLFGDTVAFFVGWTYWVISWVSTTVVVITATGALSPFLGYTHPIVDISLQITLLIMIMFLNLRGVQAAGKVEFVLILMKFIPLITLPFVALFYFDINHFSVSSDISRLPTSSILSQVTLITFFGFIGLECATTPAGEIHHPTKTIPKAIIAGTLCVAFIYFLNSVGIMGVIPSNELVYSKAPYVDASRIIFGGNWHFLISGVAFIVCLGTLNAWILASGQVMLGLAEDGLMPPIFQKRNRYGAPTLGVVISCLGMIPFLILTANKSLSQQINEIIDFSVSAFLFVYLSCCFSFLKLKIREKSLCVPSLVYGIFSILFCCWVIYETPIMTLLIACLFVVSGIPVYFLGQKNKTQITQS